MYICMHKNMKHDFHIYLPFESIDTHSSKRHFIIVFLILVTFETLVNWLYAQSMYIIGQLQWNPYDAKIERLG